MLSSTSRAIGARIGTKEVVGMSKAKVLLTAWILLGVAVAGAAYLVTTIPQPAYAAKDND
jgi:hypothetical protein